MLKGRNVGLRQWHRHSKGNGKPLPWRTHVQVLQAVPTKRVLAILAHHLGAAFISLNVNAANRALLDRGIRICPKESPRTKQMRQMFSQGHLCDGQGCWWLVSILLHLPCLIHFQRKEWEVWILSCSENPIRNNLWILAPNELCNYTFYSWLLLVLCQINTSPLITQSLNKKYIEGARL